MAAKLLAAAALCGSTLCGRSADASIPLYKKAGAPVADRVQDLLSRMTVEEKVAQILNPVGSQDGPGHFAVNATYLLAQYGTTGLGTVYTGVGGCPNSMAGWECQNYLQSSIINSSRLEIPISFIGETLVAGCSGATIFPQPVLQGATFNVDLISQMGVSIARQARLGGIDRGLSPVLQVDTDARFGRFEEAYGECPYLVSTMGVAVALSLQGDSSGPNNYLPDFVSHISLEAKHALAYGYGGRDWYRADMSDRTLYDVYARPWKNFIREAGGRGLMVAHPEVNGLPLHGNRKILTDVLRNWFGGGAAGTGSSLLIASDWGNVEGIPSYGVQANRSEAGMMAVWAGLDNEMSPPPLAMATLVDSVSAGHINMSYIDRAAGNNLREKFATGLFDGAWKINGTALQTGLDLPQDRQLAYTIASEGVILLQNNPMPGSSAPLLPLQGIGSTIKSIALLGPLGGCVTGEHYPCLAQQGMAGHYVQFGAHITTMVDAIGNGTQGSGVSMRYVPGAEINGYDESGIPAAVSAALAADLTLIAVGDSVPISTGSCSEMIDSDTTDLPGSQLALINATVATGKPVVVLLFNCRPTTFGAGMNSRFGANNALLTRIPAVVVAWRPGEEGATAVWDVLTGKVNPSGRLTQNWVRTAGAVKGPASPYLQARGSTTNDYFTEPASPLFPFGHGLSYSKFSITSTSINPSTGVLGANDTFTVSGSVSSQGPAGKISLLVYFSQDAPTKWARFHTQLMCFTKVSVPANSAGTPFSVSCRVKDMEAYEPDTGDYEVMTGQYTIQLGTDMQSPALGQWTINVQGTYEWAWDFTQ